MKIIEKLIISKNGNIQDCEDGLFINENFIAVIDGVTSKGNLLWNNEKSGCYAKDILTEALQNMDKNIESKKAIEYLNNSINIKYKERLEMSRANATERLQASIIIYSISKNEIWSFGDCQFIINKVLFNNKKKIDTVISEIRSFYLHHEIKFGKTIDSLIKKDTGREYIMPLLKMQEDYSNSKDKEFGYNILDGFNINLNNVITIKLKKGDEVILSSDGYPILKDTLKKSEDYLSKIIKEDPLCISKFKSTKGIKLGNISFDDRTYIKFIV